MQEAPSLSELSVAVRDRLVAVVSDALPRMTQLPVPLRKVAQFDPRRRARLGRAAILDALESAAFRAASGLQVSVDHPDWSEDPDALTPVDRTAAAWLLRAEGWDAIVAQHLAAATVRDEAARDREIDELRVQVVHLEDAARHVDAELRARVEDLRSENALIRQRLGEARAQVRALEQQGHVAAHASDEAAASARADLTRAEKETRQLRAQLAQADAGTAAERRARRRMREDESVRARVLLETLLDAATGLRRELALPPVTGLPADAVDARHAAVVPDALPTGAGGVPESQVLAHVLAMPRARLLVDGYNLSKSAWPASTLEAQRIRLLGLLAPLVAQSAVETTVVFDGHTSTHRPPVNAPRGIKVVFSPRGVIADDVLVEYVEAEPEGRVVVLVTSDQGLAALARGLGARVIGASTLLELLAR